MFIELMHVVAIFAREGCRQFAMALMAVVFVSCRHVIGINFLFLVGYTICIYDKMNIETVEITFKLPIDLRRLLKITDRLPILKPCPQSKSRTS